MDLLGGLDMSAPVTQQPPMPAMGGGLMDLLGGLDMSAPVTQQPPMPAMGGGLMDLLGGGAQATAVAPQNTMDLLGGLDLMGGGPIATPAPVAVATPAGGIPSITAWEKNGLVVKFDFNKNPQQPNVLQILLTATNSTQAPMGNFLFQIAVPTNMQLQLQAQSSSVIPPMNGGSVTQRILLNNPQHVAIRMRTKISYQGGMGPVDEMGEVSNFPPNAL